jgi:hypothetical protein
MQVLQGKAAMHDGERSRAVHLAVDIPNACIIAQYPHTPLEDERALMQHLASDAQSVVLSDVEIVTSNGLLKAQRIDGLSIQSYKPPVSAPLRGVLPRTLHLEEYPVGIVTVRLVPSTSMLTFTRDSAEPESELVFGGSSLSLRHTEYSIGGFKMSVVGDKPFVLVRSNQSLGEKERRIRLAQSLLMGRRITLVAHLEACTVRINLSNVAIAPDTVKGITFGARMSQAARDELNDWIRSEAPCLEVWNASLHNKRYEIVRERLR